MVALIDSQSFDVLSLKQNNNTYQLSVKGYWWKGSSSVQVDLGGGVLNGTVVKRRYHVNTKATYIEFTVA